MKISPLKAGGPHYKNRYRRLFVLLGRYSQEL